MGIAALTKLDLVRTQFQLVRCLYHPSTGCYLLLQEAAYLKLEMEGKTDNEVYNEIKKKLEAHTAKLQRLTGPGSKVFLLFPSFGLGFVLRLQETHGYVCCQELGFEFRRFLFPPLFFLLVLWSESNYITS